MVKKIKNVKEKGLEKGWTMKRALNVFDELVDELNFGRAHILLLLIFNITIELSVESYGSTGSYS